MIKNIEVKELSEILNILQKQPYDERVGRNRASYLYRGLSNSSYKLETSLKRNCKDKQYDIESSILRNFAKYAINEDPELKDSIWRQLILGQHHGLPTRLLDWTYSPLVGLHFATSGEALSDMDKNDCLLWEIDIEELNKLLPSNYQKILKKENAFIFTPEMLSAFDINQYDLDMSDNSFVIIEPPSIDQRIVNQYSYFSVMPRNIDNFENFLDENTENTIKYIINKNLKWRIRDMLDQLNMNERIIYPGLDGLSSWLKRHYYVK